MSLQFEIKPDATNTKRRLLICSSMQMEFVVIDAGREPDLVVPKKQFVYVAGYNGDGSGSIAYFFLKTDNIGSAMEKWSGNSILQAIRYYSWQMGMGNICFVLNHFTGFRLFVDQRILYDPLVEEDDSPYPFDKNY